MLVTEYDYGVLTFVVALGAFVVAARLLVCIIRCEATKGRLTILVGGVATLFGLGVASLFDAVDNIVWHPALLVAPLAWISAVSAVVMTIWFEMFGRYFSERTDFERKLEALATTDPLTGIPNRRACLERGNALAEAAKRYGHPLTVMMIDIDHFKQINDLYGHVVGDEMLCLFASVVKSCLRQVDVFGRLGGEEFAVLMPETTRNGAFVGAERIRSTVEQAELNRSGQKLSITVSIGAVSGDDTLEVALRKADIALYLAKQDGRNRVVMADSHFRPVQEGVSGKWRKTMRTCLIGAVVTLSDPSGAVRAEAIAPPEDGVTSFESGTERGVSSVAGSQKVWSHGEPRVNDMIADPIVQLLMRRDGVTSDSLVALMDAVRTTCAGTEP